MCLAIAITALPTLFMLADELIAMSAIGPKQT